MDQQYCPNCGIRRQPGVERCSACDWIPLQSTELVFLDVDRVACPRCSTRRPVSVPACPTCGATGFLQDEATGVATFGLSSLLLLTTWIAVCVALARLLPLLGAAVFLVSGLSLVRCGALMCERKRYRYPVSLHDVWRLVGSSIAGVLLGGAFFVGAIVVETMLIGILLGGLMSPLAASPMIGLLYFSFLALLMQVPAIILLLQRPGNVRAVVRGAELSVACCVGILVCVMLLPRGWWAFCLALVMVPVVSVLYWACRRAESTRLSAYIVGCTSGIWPLSVLVAVVWGSDGMYQAAFALCSASFLLLPSLLALFLLQSMWSWEDAFPRRMIPSNDVPRPVRSMGTSAFVLDHDAEDGIQYPDHSLAEPAPTGDVEFQPFSNETPKAIDP